MRRLWGIARPRIAVCGLNPHAGESGHLGTEDRDVIAPAIARARAAGMLVDGPLPADTVFVPRNLSNYDVVLAMYHDQGLPVLKHAGFGHAVNVTLGLPIVRTSVDHGTALDLAGTGRADAGSLAAATLLAMRIRRAPSPGRALIFARKRFGQHFLHDRGVLDRIVREIGARARRGVGGDRPGPRRTDRSACIGQGARTLDAIEIDRDLAAALGTRWGAAADSSCTRPMRWIRLRGARGFARRTAARHRQPALQHFDTAAVPPGGCA